ncbi:MAG: flavin reductase [Bacteroidales bacterium]|jgi:flavin reductase (DIM6/NTAB) family NADH-FMN oxidoreductase RutF|nr:flavin reductase [Bacteroidales bacterium]
MQRILSISVIAVFVLFCGCKNENVKKMDENQTKEWKQINPEEISDNSIALFHDVWAIITAGEADDFNMMTASWGMLGTLWERPTAFCFVRPQRHTFNFTEKEDTFTLSFFDEKYRDQLQYLGTVSGRDEDKLKGSGFTKKILPSGNISYEEARLIIECKKIYVDFFKEENFLDASIPAKIYAEKDFHRIYIGVITNVWEKK